MYLVGVLGCLGFGFRLQRLWFVAVVFLWGWESLHEHGGRNLGVEAVLEDHSIIIDCPPGQSYLKMVANRTTNLHCGKPVHSLQLTTRNSISPSSK